MVDAVVSFALKKIDELLTQEASFLSEVTHKIDELQAELRRIQTFLKDAAKRSNAKKDESGSIRHRISEIRGIAYDAEDILETYVLQVASKRGGGGVKNFLKRSACIFYEAETTHELGSKIDDFKAKLSNIRESFTTSGIQTKEIIEALQASTSSSQVNPYETFPHVVDTDLVGLKHNVKKLVTNLVDVNYRAVSIWGMGGVGKTTLAKQIYNHKQVKNHFTHFAWASISQQCQTHSQWKQILIQFSSPSPEDRQRIKDLEPTEVATELCNFMTNNKCLVVIDDIWNVEDWDSLKIAFPNESNSKMLLTSRIENVALAVNVDLHRRTVIHELGSLQEEQSWDLFQKIVFCGENNAELEKLGKKMVEHCKGLPLAIRVLGGLLARRIDIAEWEILYNDIESRPEGNDTRKVDNVLSLSYDHLPIELKPCFLYMGMFPEDYEIPFEKLFHYWVAEGFVSSTTGNTADDHCKSYIHQLIERSMVLRGSTDEETGLEMETCRMHDRMRDLCLSKGEEENFLRVYDLSLQREKNDVFSRRLALHMLEGKDLMDEEQSRHPSLRSLVYLIPPYRGKFEIKEKSFLDLLYLRVLDLDNITFKEGKLYKDLDNITFKEGKLYKGIGKLIHLRYLSLRYSNIRTLPSSLGNLTLLLTLDLRIGYIGRCKPRLVIPNVIWKMENLMHLFLPENRVSTKIDLGKLSKLETVENFEIGVMNMEDLCNMVNLRRLTLFFRGEHNNRIKKEYIIFNDTLKIALKNLLELGITFSFFSRLDLVDGLVTKMVSACTNLYKLEVCGHILIQKNVIFSPKITSMEFISCSFEEEDPMSIFEKLPNLRYLMIDHVKFEGRQMVCSTGGFPQLTSLHLLFLKDLEEWRVEEGAMPNLRHLGIWSCGNLKILPDGLRLIKTLKLLKIWHMPKEFGDRLKEGGEDFHKFQHIPFRFHQS